MVFTASAAGGKCRDQCNDASSQCPCAHVSPRSGPFVNRRPVRAHGEAPEHETAPGLGYRVSGRLAFGGVGDGDSVAGAGQDAVVRALRVVPAAAPAVQG